MIEDFKPDLAKFLPNAPANPADVAKVKSAPQASSPPPISTSPGKEEEINDKLALSRDKARANPSQVNSQVNRGSVLDIGA